MKKKKIEKFNYVVEPAPALTRKGPAQSVQLLFSYCCDLMSDGEEHHHRITGQTGRR